MYLTVIRSCLLLLLFAACKSQKTAERRLIIYPDPSIKYIPDTFRHLLPILDSIWYRDQFYRYDLVTSSTKKQNEKSKTFRKNAERVKEWDALNLSMVEDIISKYGWLGPRQVGIRGASALFLPIQHADLKTQEKYLPIIRQAAIDKRIIAVYYAMFVDRIEIRNNRPQIYGTQINGAGGKYEVMPLVNPDSVDAWRKSINMAQTMEQYLKIWNLTWDKEEYKKQLPGLMKKYGMVDSLGRKL